MDNSFLKQILNEYDKKRTKAILEAEQRKKELLDVNPKLAEIEQQLSSISIQAAKSILISEPDKKQKLLKDLKKQTNSLLKEKSAFLKQISKDSSYLDPHFECKLCKDTGFIEKDGTSSMCTCLKQKIYDIAYNKSNIGNLERENFSTFNPKLFSDKVNKELYKSEISPRENILLLKEKAETFIENFDNINEKNLLFTGNTGCGKTFLTNCIANEMLKQGKNVLYQTAPVMLDNIIDTKFGKENAKFDLIENVLTADLLVIDDLGTETLNHIKASELFTIINTRLLNQNHKITKTIISTNLSINQLFETYSTRIGSRLVGNYKFLRFFGEDLRYKKTKKD